MAVDEQLLAATSDNSSRIAPVYMVAAVVQCHICPVGTDCGVGTTLERLPLAKGYFRIANTSTDVRVCPDARANCSSTFGSSECVSSSGCQGGFGDPCAPGVLVAGCQMHQPRCSSQRMLPVAHR
jgi:hypothetical protein